MKRMTTTQNARQARADHFANIRNSIALLGHHIDRVESLLADAPADDWAYTGRGAELADIEARAQELADFARLTMYGR